MQLAKPQSPEQRETKQSFFLAAYRDHLMTELAEVERRIAECQSGGGAPDGRAAVGLES